MKWCAKCGGKNGPGCGIGQTSPTNTLQVIQEGSKEIWLNDFVSFKAVKSTVSGIRTTSREEWVGTI